MCEVIEIGINSPRYSSVSQHAQSCRRVHDSDDTESPQMTNVCMKQKQFEM